MDLCEVYIEGKQTQKPYDNAYRREKQLLQLVHSDLIGSITPESLNGKKYVLILIDDYSHFYILNQKQKFCDISKQCFATAHFNTKISRFHCDNGIEYLSIE